MMRMIVALQNQVNIQVEAANLSECFNYEGFENRENLGEGPSGSKNVGEGTSIGQEQEKEKEKENEEDKEEEKDDEEKDNKQDDIEKDKDDEEDQGNARLGGSDSTDSDDGDDEELIVEHSSVDQGSKHVYTTAEGHVLEDNEKGDNIDDPIDVSLLLHKSDDEQTPPAEVFKTKSTELGGSKLPS
ncbi:hypothetical protein L1987_12847 [Smallanthus sonchifolius]|uniref:Uncharacterized protein n=1 Tax=Smallanthus sonchifolius TaxID=185202 RepID=A0ACB9JH04_9ASTR|nr:hypothetical protein L1987_12847 [Smallanthus sonchifolius]